MTYLTRVDAKHCVTHGGQEERRPIRGALADDHKGDAVQEEMSVLCRSSTCLRGVSTHMSAKRQ